MPFTVFEWWNGKLSWCTVRLIHKSRTPPPPGGLWVIFLSGLRFITSWGLYSRDVIKEASGYTFYISKSVVSPIHYAMATNYNRLTHQAHFFWGTVTVRVRNFFRFSRSGKRTWNTYVGPVFTGTGANIGFMSPYFRCPWPEREKRNRGIRRM